MTTTELQQSINFYKGEISRIDTNTGYAPHIKVADSNGGATKFISLNPESAKVMIDWLTDNYIPKPPRTIEFTRLNNDVNGNPRYACHYSEFIKDGEFDGLATINKDGSTTTVNQVIHILHGMSRTDFEYKTALKRAKMLGGGKYNNKSYGGGIVFTSYNINELEKQIIELSK